MSVSVRILLSLHGWLNFKKQLGRNNLFLTVEVGLYIINYAAHADVIWSFIPWMLTFHEQPINVTFYIQRPMWLASLINDFVYLVCSCRTTIVTKGQIIDFFTYTLIVVRFLYFVLITQLRYYAADNHIVNFIESLHWKKQLETRINMIPLTFFWIYSRFLFRSDWFNEV